MSEQEKAVLTENLSSLWAECNTEFLALAHRRDLPHSLAQRHRELNEDMNQIEQVLRALECPHIHIRLDDIQRLLENQSLVN